MFCCNFVWAYFINYINTLSLDRFFKTSFLNTHCPILVTVEKWENLIPIINNSSFLQIYRTTVIFKLLVLTQLNVFDCIFAGKCTKCFWFYYANRVAHTYFYFSSILRKSEYRRKKSPIFMIPRGHDIFFYV